MATKHPASPVLAATITMAGPQIEIEPKTEQSLVVPAAGYAWWKSWRASVGRRTWLLTACAVGAAALLLACIVLYWQTTHGTEERLHGKVQVLPGDTVLREGPLPVIAPFDANQAVDYQKAWAKHLGTKVEIENSLGMKLRLIPPGEFLMGSPQAEIDALVKTYFDKNWHASFRGECPQHRVELTQAFYLGSCEVTQQQYQEVMGVNPSHFSPGGEGKDAVKDRHFEQYPVENVSWFDAIDFCNKLSEREQRVPYYVRDGELVKIQGGTGYRLPTEAEWEFACRAGTTCRWSFGDNEQDLAQHAWCNLNAAKRTHTVAEFSANPFGLYDLYGNVWEWCWDWYGGYATGAISDPTGAKPGLNRVNRGGGFDFDAAFCRSAIRVYDQPTLCFTSLGFRLAAATFGQASESGREAGSVSREGP